jgi:hypothetical protein
MCIVQGRASTSAEGANADRICHRRIAVGVVGLAQLLLSVGEEADLTVAVGELGACLQTSHYGLQRGSSTADSLACAPCPLLSSK